MYKPPISSSALINADTPVMVLVGISLCLAATAAFVPTPLPRRLPYAAVSIPLSSPRIDLLKVPLHMSANTDDSTDDSAESSQVTTPVSLPLSVLIPFLTLVMVKTATDLVTNHVVRPPATAMALVAELAIFPLIVLWLAVGNGITLLRRRSSDRSLPMRDIRAVFVSAAKERPGALLGIGAVYALDGLVYFYAHSNVGAVTYTVLAQTKIFFTVAVLRMRNMLPKLTYAQLAGLVALFAGANLVTLKDVATGVAATSGNRAIGVACLLRGQACTSAANVAYEKRLREPGCDLWVRNVQLTAAISLWLAVSSATRAALILAAGGVPPPPRELLAAFCAPWVWLVVALKAATAVLIALTISAGGNVLYAVSKPWPVVLATLATCVTLGKVPSLGFIGGITLSVSGIGLYYLGKAR